MKIQFKKHDGGWGEKFYYSTNDISTWLILWKIGFKHQKIAKILTFIWVTYK